MTTPDRLNKLESLKTLENRYFLMRHGHAISNLQDILVGNPDRGTSGFGLTPLGMGQVKEAARAFKKDAHFETKQLKLISSDFLRAKETAEICREIFEIDEPLEFTQLIRERDFGDINLKPVAQSRVIEGWDLRDMNSAEQNVEPLATLLNRMTQQIVELEQRFKGRLIFLVSHGDPIRVLEAAMGRFSIPDFRQILHFTNAQIKEFHLGHKVTLRGENDPLPPSLQKH